MCFVNIHIQNSLTKYGFFGVLQKSTKHFLISIFLFTIVFPHAPPPPPLQKNIFKMCFANIYYYLYTI